MTCAAMQEDRDAFTQLAGRGLNLGLLSGYKWQKIHLTFDPLSLCPKPSILCSCKGSIPVLFRHLMNSNYWAARPVLTSASHTHLICTS